MTEIKAQKCEFNGDAFDSLLEGRFAAFLYSMNIAYKREGCSIHVNGTNTLPDFYLENVRIIHPFNRHLFHNMNLIIETKGDVFLKEEKVVSKLYSIAKTDSLLVVSGIPSFKNKELFLPEFKNDIWKTSYNYKTIFMKSLPDMPDIECIIGIDKEGNLCVCPYNTYNDFLDVEATINAIRQATKTKLNKIVEEKVSTVKTTRNFIEDINPIEFIPRYGEAEITIGQARYILKKYYCDVQREVKVWKVEEIANLIKSKDLTKATPLTFCYIKETGKFVLVDGQHRLTALLSLGDPKRNSEIYSYSFIIVVRQVNTEEQANEVYNELADNEKGAHRDAACRIYNEVPDKKSKKQAIQRAIFKASPLAENFLNSLKRRDELKYNARQVARVYSGRWEKHGIEYFNIIASNATANIIKCFKKTSIIAFGMILIEALPEMASAFIAQASNPIGLSEKTPARFLYESLIGKHKDAKESEKLALFVNAWNLFYDKKLVARTGLNPKYDIQAEGILGVVRKYYRQGSLLELVNGNRE